MKRDKPHCTCGSVCEAQPGRWCAVVAQYTLPPPAPPETATETFLSDMAVNHPATFMLLIKGLLPDRPEPDTSPAGIGDITSDAKGSGARFNSGKPDFSLIPLTLLAVSVTEGPLHEDPPGLAIGCLGMFQRTHDATFLHAALDHLGHEGWEECARVFAYGARKYAAWNWAKGMPWSVPLACAARHLLAMARGESTDPESGEPHRGHVFCNVVMLLQYAKTYPEGNDLPPKGLL